MTGIQSEVSSGEIKRGWPIVSSAAIGIGLGLSPLPFYTIGIFIGPMAKEFGWAPLTGIICSVDLFARGGFYCPFHWTCSRQDWRKKSSVSFDRLVWPVDDVTVITHWLNRALLILLVGSRGIWGWNFTNNIYQSYK